MSVLDWIAPSETEAGNPGEEPAKGYLGQAHQTMSGRGVHIGASPTKTPHRMIDLPCLKKRIKGCGVLPQTYVQGTGGGTANGYPDKPIQTKGLFTNMLWAFYHEMLPGDYVIARRGRKTLAGVGKVTGPAVWSPHRNPNVEHAGFLDVAWQAAPRDKSFPSVVFPMHTLAEYSEEQFKSAVEGSGPPIAPPENEPEIEDPSEFVLEKYLEDFIVSNFDTIFKGRLRVFEDTEGNDGQQYATDIGPIDILAVEEKTKAFVVMELKKGRPSDRVVGQILRYMGWVKRNLCENGKSVKGLVICREHDPKLTYALEMTNNIDVRYYSVSFKLRDNP